MSALAWQKHLNDQNSPKQNFPHLSVLIRKPTSLNASFPFFHSLIFISKDPTPFDGFQISKKKIRMTFLI